MRNKTSSFTGVYVVTKHSSQHKPFRMQFNREGVQTTKCYATEREAAIACRTNKLFSPGYWNKDKGVVDTEPYHFDTKPEAEIETMNGAIERVYEIVREYQSLSRTEKWVILIEFRRENTPFLNEGVSMSLNYALANKKQFGEQIEYCLVRKDMSGKYVEIGNYLPTHKFSHTEGVIGGESLELDYTEEKIKTLEDLSEKLNLLCQKLSELCNSENQFMMLVSNMTKMLGD